MFKDKNITIIEDFSFDKPKTKNYLQLLSNFKLNGKKTLLILNESNQNILLSARNLNKTNITTSSNLNTYQIMNAGNILMVERKQQFEKGSKSKNDYFFYDRGIPDILAYLNFKKIKYKRSMMKDILKFNYDAIFIAEPWESIYKNDSERYETFDELLEIDIHIKKIYKQLGYNIIIIPKESVKDRVTFILETLN